MDDVKNSEVFQPTLLQDNFFPTLDIYIKQEVDLQGNPIEEEFIDLPEVKVEVPEYTISPDQLENNVNQCINNLDTFAEENNKSGEAAADIFPTKVLQIKIEESDYPNTENQLNPTLSCTVNLHRGINLTDIEKCKICQKLKQNRYQLNKTKPVSVGKKPKEKVHTSIHQCKKCGLRFLLEDNLKKHLKNHPESSSFRSSAITSNHFSLNKNRNLKRKHSPIIDSDSDIESNNEFDACMKDLSQSENYSYICKYCNYKFPLKSQFEKHFESCSNQIYHESSSLKVSDSNSNQNSRNSELQSFANNDNNINQSVVISTNNSSSSLQSGNRYFRCLYCSSKFLFKYELTQHLKIHYSRNFKCSVCGKEFEDQNALNAHSRCHIKAYIVCIAYRCKVCKKEFIQEDLLKEHEKTHTVVVYGCGFCKKKLLSENELRLHSQLCKKAKLCKKQKLICIATSNQNANAQEYKYNDCDQVFTSKIDLSNHRKHAKHRSYALAYITCNKCGVKFASDTDAKRHTIQRHGNRIYQCEECHRFFEQYSAFKAHVRFHKKQKQKKQKKVESSN